MSDWPFGTMRHFSYDVIMADPPWSFDAWSEGGNAKNAKAQYDCMPIQEICALPVDLLAKGDCWLWLWATYPTLPQAMAAMAAWRFTYITGGAWVKRGESGKLAMGTGYVLRGNAEPFLIGRFGKMPTFSRSIRNVIEAPRRQHSRKPDEAYAICEELFGPAFRADLFSRESRPGWDAWGRQLAKFDAVSEALL